LTQRLDQPVDGVPQRELTCTHLLAPEPHTRIITASERADTFP
jgi:hypothetical protein